MHKPIITNAQDVVITIAKDVKQLKQSVASLATMQPPSPPPVVVEKEVPQPVMSGSGMPNGKVTASVGTLYVDNAKTNGAFVWVKSSGTGNTGWDVIHGDTGWRHLPSVADHGNAKVHIRRVNNAVYLSFGGLSYGWYGVKQVDLLPSQLFVGSRTVGGKSYTWIRLQKVAGENHFIPPGFRTQSSLFASVYNDAGDTLGVLYIGSVSDANCVRMQLPYAKETLTPTMLQQLRFGAVSFLTHEPWPTTLP